MATLFAHSFSSSYNYWTRLILAVSLFYTTTSYNYIIVEGVCLCVSQILWGSLETTKMVGFGWSFAHLFLGWISGDIFFIFLNFDFWGLGWGWVFAKTRLNLCRSLETSNIVRFGWNFAYFLSFWFLRPWRWAFSF